MFKPEISVMYPQFTCIHNMNVVLHISTADADPCLEVSGLKITIFLPPLFKRRN